MKGFDPAPCSIWKRRYLACVIYRYANRGKKVIKNGILYKTDPDPDPDIQEKQTPDLQKKCTLYKKSLHELKTHL